ncbi:hypothetical protein Hanom_Chr09g00776691 [Helianthus anomalus]
MYGWKPDPNAVMYTSKGSGPVPSRAQTPTSSSSAQVCLITANQWALVTNQNQSKPKMARNIYGEPQPVASKQSYRSTRLPSSLDPNYHGQTRPMFYAKIVKDVSNGESSLKTIQTQVKAKMDESSREVVDSAANESVSESESSQVCVDEPSSDRCDSCVELNAKLCDLQSKLSDLQSKYDDLQSKYDVTFIHNQSLIVDLSKCTEANIFHKNHENEFKKIINTLKEDKSEQTKNGFKKTNCDK